MMTNLAQYTDIRVALVVGSLSLNVQAATLRSSPEGRGGYPGNTPTPFSDPFLIMSAPYRMSML